MTCLEAQTKIIAYIDDKLEKEEKTDFLYHVKGCADCREELDIYYTMIEGMRQLDGNLPLSKDFTKELDDRIERELKITRHKKGFVWSFLLVITVLVLGFSILSYTNFLDLLHEDEQNQIKKAQGEYYFSDTFDSILFEVDEDERMLDINISTQEEQPSYYQRVREHRVFRENSN